MIDEIKEALKHYHTAISELSSFNIEGHCDCAESCIAVIERIVGYDKRF